MIATDIGGSTGRGTGTGTGTDGSGGAGWAAGGAGTTRVVKGAPAGGGSGAAAAVGPPDTCLSSLAGLPKVPGGKKNPAGGSADATDEWDSAAG